MPSRTRLLIEIAFNELYAGLWDIDRVPQLPQYAQSLWIYGHRSKMMVYCNDTALAEHFGERYAPIQGDWIVEKVRRMIDETY